jgi:hypothetical protein
MIQTYRDGTLAGTTPNVSFRSLPGRHGGLPESLALERRVMSARGFEGAKRIASRPLIGAQPWTWVYRLGES